MSRARQSLPDHPVRVALLDLLAELGTVTSTQAAARLGHSSGLCSFHLRQLARHGLIEEVPREGGRARPWRLRWESGPPPDQNAPERFDDLARGLEDESYQHWLSHRDRAPADWKHDESFSAVVHLTPAEMAELAASIRLLVGAYRDRDHRAVAGARPVAAVARLFPLLDDDGGSGGATRSARSSVDVRPEE
ncbi:MULTISPECIES: helix-turn-helix domain-containing protein [Streptomyces]|uniref:helix-turn-helix domain-containing protein n=1 Tax=unclassified Streptomyces TaxID=2593676 RepID=UPI0019256233|nr:MULTISPECIES: helix-turn-helix domain-containing protein [Streptomyces]